MQLPDMNLVPRSLFFKYHVYTCSLDVSHSFLVDTQNQGKFTKQTKSICMLLAMFEVAMTD
jgi:hypothetical protein